MLCDGSMMLFQALSVNFLATSWLGGARILEFIILIVFFMLGVK